MKIKMESMSPEINGFYGAYYPNSRPTDKAMILMLGDSSDDRLAKSGAKWIHGLGCHALAMSPAQKDYGHHNYPLERFGAAISFLKDRGIKKIGIAGASTTGMLALVAASYYQDITLTIAMSPSDFIMEGFYRDNKDGMHFVFPESLLNIMLPGLGNLMPLIFSAGRKYPRECKAVRVDIDNKLNEIIREW